MSLARRCVVIVMGAGMLACSDSTGPTVDLEVTISVSAATVSSSAPVTVLVTAINRGPDPVEVNAKTCPEMFAVIGIDGQNLGAPTLLCQLNALIATLEPGESIELDHTWDGTMTGGGNQFTREPLPLGVYQLIGGIGGALSEPTSIEVVTSG